MVAPGKNRADHGSVSWRTFCSCSARQARSRSRSAASWFERIAIASRRGVRGAAVADGQRADRHAARHLHDRQQRIHALERAALDRHAEHRQRRVRGHHPGQVRRAAGAAMITWMPRPSAADAYSAIRAGVRCAETTRHSCGTPNAVSISSAWRIVSQSDLLPMITATSGRSSVMRAFYCQPGEGGARRVGLVLDRITRSQVESTGQASGPVAPQSAAELLCRPGSAETASPTTVTTTTPTTLCQRKETCG